MYLPTHVSRSRSMIFPLVLAALLLYPGGASLAQEQEELTPFQVRHGDVATDSQPIPFDSLRVRDAPSPNERFDKAEYRREYGDRTRDVGRAWNKPDLRSPPVIGSGLSLDLEFESVDLQDVAVISGGFIGTPPDTMGAVGPTQYFTTLNNAYRVHDKTTGVADTSLDVLDSDFWVPAVDSNDSGGGDPRVRFDRLNNRWVVIAFTTNPLANNRLLVALSDGPTISATTVWTQYYIIPKDTVGGGSEDGCFADYPMLGVDAKAIYLGANMFRQTGGCGGTGGTNTAVFVIPFNGLPVGGGNASSATTAFTGLRSGTNAAPIWSPMPADNMDPNATTGYIIGHDAGSDTILKLGKISNPDGAPGVPTIAWTNITVSNKNDGFSSGASPCGVPFPGNPTPGPCFSGDGVSPGEWGLDPLGFRPLGGAIVRDGRLWTAMTSSVTGPNGDLSLWPTVGDRNSVVFFEIDVNTNALIQDGNVFDQVTAENTGGAPTTPLHVFMGSVAVNGQGHAVVGATGTDTSATAPSGVWAGRLAGDPLGDFSHPQVFRTGTNTGEIRMDFETSDRHTRWGDYAQVTVDPCDDMTFYAIAEFQDTPALSPTRSNWGTTVARINAPAPLFSAAGDAEIGSASAQVDVTGSGFYNPPATGMPPCRTEITASSSTSGVSVNSVAYVGPTSITLDLDTTGASVGSANIVVTNPDGQSVNVTVPLISSDAIFANGFETGTIIWSFFFP